MFIAACEGYFDKQDELILLARKQAQGSFMGTNAEFNKWWPVPKLAIQEHHKKTWGSAEEANEMRRAIEKAHGIKLG